MLDWLANISVKWAVVIVGLLVVVRMSAPRLDWLPKAFRQFLVDYAETFAIAAAFVFLVLHRFVFQLFFIPSESMVPTLLVNDRIVVNRFVYRFQPPERGEIVVFHAPPQASPTPKDFVKRVIGLPNETIEIVPDRLVIDRRPVAHLISGTEASDAQRDLVVPAGARLDIVESQLLVDGRPFVVLSRTGGAAPRPDALYVDGRPVQAFSPGEVTEPLPLPPFLRHAGLQGSLFSDGAGNALYVIRGRQIGLDPGHVRINGKPLGLEPYVRETPRYHKGPIKLGPDEYFMLGDNRNNSADSHAWGPLSGDRIVGKATLMFWPPTRAGLLRAGELYAQTAK